MSLGAPPSSGVSSSESEAEAERMRDDRAATILMSGLLLLRNDDRVGAGAVVTRSSKA